MASLTDDQMSEVTRLLREERGKASRVTLFGGLGALAALIAVLAWLVLNVEKSVRNELLAPDSHVIREAKDAALTWVKTNAGKEPLKGARGTPGPSGTQGPGGLEGPVGAQGIEGSRGPQGPAGIQGVTGVKGDTGIPGPEGTRGPQGVPGSVGPTGKQGPPGERGPQGSDGIPVGAVMAWPGPNAPDGWHLCDGTPIAGKGWSSKLLEAVPTAIYDGKLPDYRGLFLRGAAGTREINYKGTVINFDHKNRKDHRLNQADSSVGSVQLGSPGLNWGERGRYGYELKACAVDTAKTTNWNVIALATGGNRERFGEETRPANVYVHWIIKVK